MQRGVPPPPEQVWPLAEAAKQCSGDNVQRVVHQYTHVTMGGGLQIQNSCHASFRKGLSIVELSLKCTHDAFMR